MEKFDLERALAGEPVITRDGREVTEIHLFKTVKTDYPLIVVVGGDNHEYTEEGKFNINVSSNDDLFMKPKVIEGWFNVYLVGVKIWTSSAYESEERAKQNIGNFDTYIKTIKITDEV